MATEHQEIIMLAYAPPRAPLSAHPCRWGA